VSGPPDPAGDLAAMMAAVLAECPDLEKVGAVGVVDVVVKDATGNLKRLEQGVAQAGGIGPEVASSFMTIAAMVSILESFPEEDDRRKLSKAGRIIGETIARRWRARIKNEIVAKLRPN
jgi:hypothetical protein